PDMTDDRYERGLQTLQAIDGGGGQRAIDALADIAPDLAHHLIAYGFGDIYSRPGLEPKQRQLVTIGTLTALGGCEAQLEVHINTSLRVGLSPAEIVEVLIQASAYCGFPRALNAIGVAKQVFASQGLLPVREG
ncbi:MAG TPA: carboxymuconolactone decarboxylase family protein, partial [Mycobacteriales bacterium]|nr:carboxymuconolactone decarboxylase family protein [Mycobacteriales bacterium]